MGTENRLSCYEYLCKNAKNGAWAERILSELGFLLEVSACRQLSLDALLLPQLEALKEAFGQNGAITKGDVLAAEHTLAELVPLAKAYDVSCVAHAHIDMNWMWGFQETAGVTVDTFRTMLELMKEYPQFTFSQSQASVYRIVEEYAPQMLPEIKKYIHEGRWELTASTWVENEKNMAGGEAMARHILYTKRYLAKLFDVAPDTLRLDFEPDTFGHPHVLPELLQQGGVDYYYHCRGAEGPYIYNWRAPSGAQVLTYREPKWYNQTVTPDLFLHVPSFCAEYGISCYLKVYGVGDHGGGPTRRDIEKILEMASWPLFPDIHFGTLHGFFDKLAVFRDHFETVDSELNSVFTGCYSSQSEIKKANRLAECRLADAEALDVMAAALCPDYQTQSAFSSAWEKTLFNQFHDILPGSGVRETRQFAMGEFQRAMTTAGVNAASAMHALNQRIDTSALELSDSADLAYGAGCGYALSEASGVHFPCAERGSGSRRVLTLWNPTAWERSGVFELTVWDWISPASRIRAVDASGNTVPVQVLEEGTHYWGHHFTRLAVQTTLAPMGWGSILLCDGTPERVEIPEFPEPRLDAVRDGEIVLENRYLRAVFCTQTLLLKSLRCKEDDTELVDPQHPAAALRLILESPDGMSAWRIGKYTHTEILNTTVPVYVDFIRKGKLRQELGFRLNFHASSIRVVVSLDADSRQLRFAFDVDWREFGDSSRGIPQLNFSFPLMERVDKSRCLSPFGFCDRDALAQDVPCNGLIAVKQADRALALLSDCKYGFRNDGIALNVTLLRASYHPDATPEIGRHTFSVCVAAEDWDCTALLRTYDALVHPISVLANTKHSGSLPLQGGLLRLDGAVLYGIKQAEREHGVIVRLYQPDENERRVTLTWNRNLQSACFVSVAETNPKEIEDVDGGAVRFSMPPHTLRSVLLKME